MPTDNADLDRLDALHAASTQGDWQCSFRGDGSGTVCAEDDIDAPELLDDARCPFMRGEVVYEDGVFAAEAHNAYPALSRELRELRECADQFYELVKAIDPDAVFSDETPFDEVVSEIEDIPAELRAENTRLREACQRTIDENGHLADGETCTLIHIKRAIAAATAELREKEV